MFKSEFTQMRLLHAANKVKRRQLGQIMIIKREEIEHVIMK